MARYNTFVVVDCNKRKNLLVTSSARKAKALLTKGTKVEVWNENKKFETIYEADKKREKDPLGPYITFEKEHIQNKQKLAEKRNNQRRKRE